MKCDFCGRQGMLGLELMPVWDDRPLLVCVDQYLCYVESVIPALLVQRDIRDELVRRG